MTANLVCFDGLVGPTLHFADGPGDGVGSIGDVAHPKRAALQGLAKMKATRDLGVPQGVMPPHERPYVRALRRVGFEGDDAAVIAQAAEHAPALLAACSASAAMWAHHAVTTAPSCDTTDARVHFTPANLQSTLSRAMEILQTSRLMRKVFADPEHFHHHSPLPAVGQLGDEGGANHTWFSAAGRTAHLFVHGQRTMGTSVEPRRGSAKHTAEASEAIARLHSLDPARVVHAQQRVEATNLGATHADLVLMGAGDLLVVHERALLDSRAVLEELETAAGGELTIVRVAEADVSLEHAVETQLFRSQLLTTGDGERHLLCTAEVLADAKGGAFLRSLRDRRLVDSVTSVELSAISGVSADGPSRLSMRVWLTDAELTRVHPGVMLTDELYDELVAWVERHYWDTVLPRDLADPALMQTSHRALDELTGILDLGSAYYPFQRG